LDEKDIGTVITDDGTPGYLYICNTESDKIKCELNEDIGYFIDNNVLYQCKTEDDEIKCNKSTKIENETSSCIVGSVVYNGDKFVICTGTEISMDLPNEKTEYNLLENVVDDTYELINNNDIGIISSSPSFVTFYSIDGK